MKIEARGGRVRVQEGDRTLVLMQGGCGTCYGGGSRSEAGMWGLMHAMAAAKMRRLSNAGKVVE